MESPKKGMLKVLRWHSHSTGGDAKTELDEQLIGDALFAPGDIVSGHSANQLLELFRNDRTALRTGFPSPEQTKSSLMPSGESCGFDDDEP